jgi:hypothetical protein
MGGEGEHALGEGLHGAVLEVPVHRARVVDHQVHRGTLAAEAMLVEADPGGLVQIDEAGCGGAQLGQVNGHGVTLPSRPTPQRGS